MKQKVNLRLSLISLVAIVAASIGIVFVFYNLFQTQIRNDLRMDAQLLMETEVFQQAYAQAGEDPDEIRRSSLGKLQTEKLRITWIAKDGTVLFDNDTDADKLTNHLDRPEIQSALSEGKGESIRRSDTFGLNTFYYALLLDNGTVLRVSTQAKTISSIFIAALPVILIIAAAVFVICILIGHALTNQLLRPIEEMAEHLDNPISSSVYKELAPFAEKIRSQHENILEAAKSRQDFTANVSHELKTPLTAISGYAELIETEMVGKESAPHIAAQIRDSAERLLLLINDIIKLSELDHKELERDFTETDLYVLSQECCNSMQVNASQNNIRLTCEGASVKILAAQDLIKELLENLIQNAIRYNEAGGYVHVQVGAENGRAFVRVKDNGIGIPKDQQSRIFERFYRVDRGRSRESGGTGLGLAIVKHIAEIHNAEIHLSSQVNVGTEVTVFF